MATGEPQNTPEFAWLMLTDIQGLYGGRALYVLPNDGFVVQIVGPSPHGLEDRRYTGALSEAQRAGITALLEQHDLRTMQVPQRPGIPDEVLVQLNVGFADGTEAQAAKWSGVAHEGFSALYGHLVVLAKALPKTGEASPVVPYDHRWRPEDVTWPR